jgi:gluconate 2-dehydrogenase gamma chain
MAEQIIPSDDTPGAREARVIRFMDLSLASFAASELPLFRRGVHELTTAARRLDPTAKSFAALSGGAQIQLLRTLEASGSPFFESVRVATINGMFANPEYGGNFEKAGWKLIGFEDRFSWGPPFGDYDRE